MAIGEESNKEARKFSTFKDQLDRQLGYLERSCDLFDQGYEPEAARIAVVLRVLLHDTTKSHSLLAQLGMKDTLRLVDTGLYRDRLDRAQQEFVDRTEPGSFVGGKRRGEAGLVACGVNSYGRIGWVAPLRHPWLHPEHWNYSAVLQEPQPFKFWWNTPLVENSEGETFSRKNLVLIMANQDGGAHVDPRLDKDYEALTVDFLDYSIMFTKGGIPPDANPPPATSNVAAASVRQIGFEVLSTLIPEKSWVKDVKFFNPMIPLLIADRCEEEQIAEQGS